MSFQVLKSDSMTVDVRLRTQEFDDRAPAGAPAKEPSNAAYTWLCVFYFIYCARPEEWIPVGSLPLAKISVIFALIGLAAAAAGSKRRFSQLPREAKYLLALVGLFFLSAAFSPVWRGGALIHTFDFAKVCIAWVLTYLVVTSFKKLKRIMFIQAASVVAIAVISLAKGHSQPRLEGVIGGIYSNPNDLAFAIVLSLPFCLAFLLHSKRVLGKMAWGVGILAMISALFLTASRAGFIDLVIAGSVCLWHFAIKGKRRYLIAVVLVVGTLTMALAGRQLKDRFAAMSGEDLNSRAQGSAYGSYEARKYLMNQALRTVAHYPLLGVGIDNFITLSGDWHEVHMTYLQVAAEGGIPGLMLYLIFFARGFSNLRTLRKRKDLDGETVLFAGALHSALIGFAVGAIFAPEAYQFFPYFAVAYTSVLVAIVAQGSAVAAPPDQFLRPSERYAIRAI